MQSQKNGSGTPDQIPVILQDLPTHIHGFVCIGSDFNPCIVINSRLTFEQQQKTYRHEIKHILTGQIYDDNYKEYNA